MITRIVAAALITLSLTHCAAPAPTSENQKAIEISAIPEPPISPYATQREVTLASSNVPLPLVTVDFRPGEAPKWNAFATRDYKSASVNGLDGKAAYRLSEIADKAISLQASMNKTDACKTPLNRSASGPIGKIEPEWGNAGMNFEVVCSNGPAQVEITMFDRYEYGVITLHANAEQLRTMANELLKTLYQGKSS